jgi:hypothetical protein
MDRAELPKLEGELIGVVAHAGHHSGPVAGYALPPHAD